MTPPCIGAGQRALRRARFSGPGQIYLLTTVSHRRTPLFKHWHVAAPVCAQLGEARLWRDARLLCWVLMPDHLHMIVALGADEPLSRLVQRAKVLTSKAANLGGAKRSADSRIWMPGFHDRALWREDDLLAMARYVVMNQVRAGLVRRVSDYPYWDAAWI